MSKLSINKSRQSNDELVNEHDFELKHCSIRQGQSQHRSFDICTRNQLVHAVMNMQRSKQCQIGYDNHTINKITCKIDYHIGLNFDGERSVMTQVGSENVRDQMFGGLQEVCHPMRCVLVTPRESDI